MVRDPRVRIYNLSSIERVTAGAAPLSAEVCNAFNKLWPDGKMDIKQGWGMTEYDIAVSGNESFILIGFPNRATSLLSTWDPNERSNPSSVGRLGPNIEAKIVNEKGGSVSGYNNKGELYVRGPNVMKRYWKRLRETETTLSADGWLRTGDVGYIDEHGQVFLLDRLKVRC